MLSLINIRDVYTDSFKCIRNEWIKINEQAHNSNDATLQSPFHLNSFEYIKRQATTTRIEKRTEIIPVNQLNQQKDMNSPKKYKAPLRKDKFQIFNDWCKREGMIYPKLEFPAYFEGGLQGVKCSDSIEHQEAYLYVPYKMIMSVGKAINHPILGKMIENSTYLSDESNPLYQENILILFILYEKTLKKII